MSSIRLTYGSYSHPLSEAACSIRRQSEFTDAGVAYAVRESWTIQGRIDADSTGAITTAINNLESAYAKQNQNIALSFDDGTSTAHGINVNNTVDGIRVQLQPSYPTGEGAEYANFRTYNLAVEALVKLNAAHDELLFWEQTIETSGGHPRDVLVETFNSVPVRQRVAESTIYFVTQSGRAVGLTTWPPASLPVVSDLDGVILRKSVRRRSPREIWVGGGLQRSMFEVTWNYVFGLQQEIGVLPGTRPY